MSLRRKDDWDEALEEAYWNAVKRGEIDPYTPAVVYRDVKQYGMCLVVSKEELGL